MSKEGKAINPAIRIKPLQDETNQLNSNFVASIKTARQNQKKTS